MTQARKKEKKEEDVKMENDLCWLMVLLTFGPAAKPARSPKATPTGNCINLELSRSNSLQVFIHSPARVSGVGPPQPTWEKGTGVRGLGARLKPPRHVLPNWFNDCNYLRGGGHVAQGDD